MLYEDDEDRRRHQIEERRRLLPIVDNEEFQSSHIVKACKTNSVFIEVRHLCRGS